MLLVAERLKHKVFTVLHLVGLEGGYLQRHVYRIVIAIQHERRNLLEFYGLILAPVVVGVTQLVLEFLDSLEQLNAQLGLAFPKSRKVEDWLIEGVHTPVLLVVHQEEIGH